MIMTGVMSLDCQSDIALYTGIIDDMRSGFVRIYRAMFETQRAKLTQHAKWYSRAS